MNYGDFEEMVKKYDGLLVGSRAWGGAKDNSDYDYIFMDKHEKEINELLKNNNIKHAESPYNTHTKSEYIEIEDKTINLIFLHRKYFYCWLQAAGMMKSFPQCRIGDRKLRRFMFTLLVDTFVHFDE